VGSGQELVFVFFVGFPSATISVKGIVLTHAIPTLATNKNPLGGLIVLNTVEYWSGFCAKVANFLTGTRHGEFGFAILDES
jgi:hypothetical protein